VHVRRENYIGPEPQFDCKVGSSSIKQLAHRKQDFPAEVFPMECLTAHLMANADNVSLVGGDPVKPELENARLWLELFFGISTLVV